jgi:hypothetical protein
MSPCPDSQSRCRPGAQDEAGARILCGCGLVSREPTRPLSAVGPAAPAGAGDPARSAASMACLGEAFASEPQTFLLPLPRQMKLATSATKSTRRIGIHDESGCGPPPGEPQSPPRRHRPASPRVDHPGAPASFRPGATHSPIATGQVRIVGWSPPASGWLTARAERVLGEEPDDCVERGLPAGSDRPGRASCPAR